MTLIKTVVRSRDLLPFHLNAGVHLTVSPDRLIVFVAIVYGKNELGSVSRQSNESDQRI